MGGGVNRSNKENTLDLQLFSSVVTPYTFTLDGNYVISSDIKSEYPIGTFEINVGYYAYSSPIAGNPAYTSYNHYGYFKTEHAISHQYVTIGSISDKGPFPSNDDVVWIRYSETTVDTQFGSEIVDRRMIYKFNSKYLNKKFKITVDGHSISGTITSSNDLNTTYNNCPEICEYFKANRDKNISIYVEIHD